MKPSCFDRDINMMDTPNIWNVWEYYHPYACVWHAYGWYNIHMDVSDCVLPILAEGAASPVHHPLVTPCNGRSA